MQTNLGAKSQFSHIPMLSPLHSANFRHAMHSGSIHLRVENMTAPRLLLRITAVVSSLFLVAGYVCLRTGVVQRVLFAEDCSVTQAEGMVANGEVSFDLNSSEASTRPEWWEQRIDESLTSRTPVVRETVPRPMPAPNEKYASTDVVYFSGGARPDLEGRPRFVIPDDRFDEVTRSVIPTGTTTAPMSVLKSMEINWQENSAVSQMPLPLVSSAIANQSSSTISETLRTIDQLPQTIFGESDINVRLKTDVGQPFELPFQITSEVRVHTSSNIDGLLPILSSHLPEFDAQRQFGLNNQAVIAFVPPPTMQTVNEPQATAFRTAIASDVVRRDRDGYPRPTITPETMMAGSKSIVVLRPGDILGASDRMQAPDRVRAAAKKFFTECDSNNDGALTQGELPDQLWEHLLRKGVIKDDSLAEYEIRKSYKDIESWYMHQK